MLTFCLLAHIGTPAENILESNLAFILFGLGHFLFLFFVCGGVFSYCFAWVFYGGIAEPVLTATCCEFSKEDL